MLHPSMVRQSLDCPLSCEFLRTRGSRGPWGREGSSPGSQLDWIPTPFFQRTQPKPLLPLGIHHSHRHAFSCFFPRTPDSSLASMLMATLHKPQTTLGLSRADCHPQGWPWPHTHTPPAPPDCLKLHLFLWAAGTQPQTFPHFRLYLPAKPCLAPWASHRLNFSHLCVPLRCLLCSLPLLLSATQSPSFIPREISLFFLYFQGNVTQIGLLRVCLSFYLSIYLPIFLSVCLPTYLSTFLSIYLSNYLSVYLSIYLSTYLSTCLPIYLFIYLYVYLYIYLPVYLFIYLSLTFLHVAVPYLSAFPPGPHIPGWKDHTEPDSLTHSGNIRILGQISQGRNKWQGLKLVGVENRHNVQISAIPLLYFFWRRWFRL